MKVDSIREKADNFCQFFALPIETGVHLSVQNLINGAITQNVAITA